MHTSYDSIDNKQKMCEKVNKDITFIQFFHSTRFHTTPLHWTIQNIFLAANPTTACLQKAIWPGKNSVFENVWILSILVLYVFEVFLLYWYLLLL